MPRSTAAAAVAVAAAAAALAATAAFPGAVAFARPPHPAIPDDVRAKLLLLETFQDRDTFTDSWVESRDGKFASQKWLVNETHGAAKLPAYFSDEKSLGMAAKHAHYGLSRVLARPFKAEGKDLVFQYEVKLHEPVSCSGQYVKLMSPPADGSALDPARLRADSPYTIMFGPDRCGGTNKVHLIIRQFHEKENVWQEKHMTKRVTPKSPQDFNSHLYTLVVRSDQTFKVYVDGNEEASGSLLASDAFSPPFGSPAEIDDPDDRKPADWVEVQKIPDPDARKPEDWDESQPEKIPDPDAVRPEGWDEDEDGAWEAPYIPNPKWRGKWVHPLIDNPEYQGPWAPRKIPNPVHFSDPRPSDKLDVAAVAIEVLANDPGVAFDNILLTDDFDAADAFARLTFFPKSDGEVALAKSIERARRKEERDAYWSQDAVRGPLAWVWGEAFDWAQENILATVLTGVALLAGTFYFCCFSQYGLCYDEPEAAAGAKARAHAHATSSSSSRPGKPPVVDEGEEEDDEGEEEEHEHHRRAEKGGRPAESGADAGAKKGE